MKQFLIVAMIGVLALASPSRGEPKSGLDTEVRAALDAAVRGIELDPDFRAAMETRMDAQNYTQEERELTIRSLETFTKEAAKQELIDRINKDERFKGQLLKEYREGKYD